MRNLHRFFSFVLSGTALSAASNLMPNLVVEFRLQPHMMPLGEVASQQAMAYSSRNERPPANTFETEYQEAWDLVDKYFLYRERLTDWSAWKHRFDGRLNNSAEADSAIEEMVSSLGDDYTFFRDGEETEKRAAEDLRRNVVTGRWASKNRYIGYVHITTFNSDSCVQEMRAQLKKLRQAQGFIVDLRQNSGGSINHAMQIFSMLIERGCFVKMVGIAEGQPDTEAMMLTPNAAVVDENGTSKTCAREANEVARKPLVVLVDSSTKSAAEMLAGALRDNRRAVVIGSRTFGKGIVQRIWQFDEGTSIKITAARYFLPSGANLQGTGLMPDIRVPSVNGRDAQLSTAIQKLSTMLGHRRAS